MLSDDIHIKCDNGRDPNAIELEFDRVNYAIQRLRAYLDVLREQVEEWEFPSPLPGFGIPSNMQLKTLTWQKTHNVPAYDYGDPDTDYVDIGVFPLHRRLHSVEIWGTSTETTDMAFWLVWNQNPTGSGTFDDPSRLTYLNMDGPDPTKPLDIHAHGWYNWGMYGDMDVWGDTTNVRTFGVVAYFGLPSPAYTIEWTVRVTYWEFTDYPCAPGLDDPCS